MPLVKPIVTGYGMNLIIVPSRAAPMTNRITPGHDGADGEIFRAVFGADAVKNDDERAGRPADGDLGAAQRRNDEARDDGRENAGLGFDARGDGKRHGQRQRHDAHGERRP